MMASRVAKARYVREYEATCYQGTALQICRIAGWTEQERAELEAKIHARCDSLRAQYAALSWWQRLFVLAPPPPGQI